MLNNLICSNTLMIVFLIFDALLIFGCISLILWYMLKTKSSELGPFKSPKGLEKVDDDTYIIPSQEEKEPEVVIEKDNAVEHFSNQIANISEEANNQLNSNTIVVKHEVETPVKKLPRKDEIRNFVVVGGVKKEKTATEKIASQNRGSDAYKNSSNFFNIIKEEQNAPAPDKKKSTTKKK